MFTSKKKNTPNPNTRTRHPIKPPQFARRPRLPIARRSSGTRGPCPKSQLCTEGPLGRIRLGIFWSRHQGRIDTRGLAPIPMVGAGGRLAVDGWSISWGFYRRSSRVFFWGFFRRHFEKLSRPPSPGHRIKTTLSEKRETKHLMLNETSKKQTYDVPKAGKEPSGKVKMPEFLSPLQVFGKVKGDTPKLFPVILTNLSPMFSL